MATAFEPDNNPALEFARLLIAAALILFGLYLAVFRNSWGPLIFGMLPESEIGAWLELIVPFLPLVFIGIGVALFASHRRSD